MEIIREIKPLASFNSINYKELYLRNLNNYPGGRMVEGWKEFFKPPSTHNLLI
jgi:hypothetical protein